VQRSAETQKTARGARLATSALLEPPPGKCCGDAGSSQAWFSTGADLSEEENVSRVNNLDALQSGSCAALFSLTLSERTNTWRKKSNSVGAGVAAVAEDAGPRQMTDSRPPNLNRPSHPRR